MAGAAERPASPDARQAVHITPRSYTSATQILITTRQQNRLVYDRTMKSAGNAQYTSQRPSGLTFGMPHSKTRAKSEVSAHRRSRHRPSLWGNNTKKQEVDREGDGRDVSRFREVDDFGSRWCEVCSRPLPACLVSKLTSFSILAPLRISGSETAGIGRLAQYLRRSRWTLSSRSLSR